MRLSSDIVASPLGRLHIVSVNGALCALDYGDFEDRMHALLRRRFGAYALLCGHDPLGMTALLDCYFAGDLGALDAVPVSGGGTVYQERVWAALRAIPPGQTRTYGDLAAQLGATHARAVGGANRLNPIAIVVPCHRVIGADAMLTGYAGGLERKAWLLGHEARHAGRSPAFGGLF